MDWAFPVCGFIVGGIVGMTGMGGGSLMTALLILVFGLHPVNAVGTDLLYAAATKATGTFVHSGNNNVAWPVVRRLAMGSLPATAVTIWFLSQVPLDSPAVARTISVAIGVALLVVAASLLFKRPMQNYAVSHADDLLHTRGAPALTVLLGAVMGIVVTLCSVGAGAIGVAVLFWLYPRMAIARIVGTDIAHAVPLTLLAGAGHWWIGSVNWTLVGLLLIGSIPGIWFGSHLANRVSERVIVPILASALVIIGVMLVAG